MEDLKPTNKNAQQAVLIIWGVLIEQFNCNLLEFKI